MTTIVYLALHDGEERVTCRCGEEFTPADPMAAEFTCPAGHVTTARSIPTSCAEQLRIAEQYILAAKINPYHHVNHPDRCSAVMGFAARPVGSGVLDVLKTGAHLVIPWLDRAAGLSCEFTKLAEAVSKKRAKLHLARENLAITGEALKSFRALAEMERRHRALLPVPKSPKAPKPVHPCAVKAPQGWEDWCIVCDVPLLGTPRYRTCHRDVTRHQCGYTLDTIRDRRPCAHEIEHMRQVYLWHEDRCWSYEAITDELKARDWRSKTGQRYNKSKVIRMCRVAKKLIHSGEISRGKPLEESPLWLRYNAARELLRQSLVGVVGIGVGEGGEVEPVDGVGVDTRPDGVLPVDQVVA